ncbi:hypothetical protein NWFMUON74_02330 [Nocardia wallacei]|uniref:Uncharacterized protein n=1 Tax=Nocardia wallacei TaxID=480035 RepID=A0A7G1KC99_9NOCA|nr:hypothetical protein NWFMUON74_02330 [Nocardia wallacei]
MCASKGRRARYPSTRRDLHYITPYIGNARVSLAGIASPDRNGRRRYAAPSAAILRYTIYLVPQCHSDSDRSRPARLPDGIGVPRRTAPGLPTYFGAGANG